MAPNHRLTVVAVLVVVELALLGSMISALDFSHDSSSDHIVMGLAPALAATEKTTPVLNKTFETGSAPAVFIDDGSSAVNVTVRPGHAVVVREQIKSSGWVLHTRRAKLDVSFADNTVSIVRRGSDPMVMAGAYERSFNIVVPPGTRLEIANAADIRVNGLRDAAKLHSENGSIEVRDHRAAVTASSDNGRIELHDVIASTAEISTGNGRIVFENVRADALTAHTDNGRIDASGVTTRGGTIESGNGRIELGLAQGNDLTVTAKASAGKVTAESPLAFEPRASGDDNDDNDVPRTLRMGNGTGKLQVSSDNGSITMSQGGVSL
jgi:hypothetical protein